MDEQDRETGNAKPSLAVVRLMGSGSIMFIFTLRPSAFIFTRKTLKIFGGVFLAASVSIRSCRSYIVGQYKDSL